GAARRPPRRRRGRLPRLRAPLPPSRLRRQRAVLARRMLLRSKALRQGRAGVPRRRAALAHRQQGARRAGQARLLAPGARRDRQRPLDAARGADRLCAHRGGAAGPRADGAAHPDGGIEVKRILLVAGLALAGDVRAQTTSNLPSSETSSGTQGLPTTETQAAPPPCQRGGWYPGMPLPPPEKPAGAADDKEKKRTGLFVNDEGGGEVGDFAAENMPAGPPPDTHVVVKGDTLWDLSARYYRNAWGWPKLWALNPQITNPHW